jgi:hypothetical protein
METILPTKKRSEDMIEELELAQFRVSSMRQSLLEEGTVYPVDREGPISGYEAKKKVLWYLDILAAILAGAHRHIRNFMHDDIFSEGEKEDMQAKVIDKLRTDLVRLLPPILKDYFYCLGNHFDDLTSHLPVSASHTCLTENLEKKREVVKDIFTQLQLLDREVDFICGELQP